MPPKSKSTPSGTTSETGGSSLKRAYLVAYNAVSATLWLGVLVQVAMVLAGEKEAAWEQGRTYGALERYTRLTQTGAGMEVLHSLVGLVRAPVFTTAMQVASRLLLVWGIGYNFPATTAESPAYSSMLIAWSVTEVIRYSYFVFALTGAVPRLWTWLRYNTFLVLYPLGVASETWLIYQAIPPASKLDEKYGWGLWAVLASYVPGFYTLFTYMLSQRRRILRADKKKA